MVQIDKNERPLVLNCISAIEKEVENWKGLPIEARFETKVRNLSYSLCQIQCDLL